eukprot:755712-Rhodomonas_salina.4
MPRSAAARHCQSLGLSELENVPGPIALLLLRSTVASACIPRRRRPGTGNPGSMIPRHTRVPGTTTTMPGPEEHEYASLYQPEGRGYAS